MPGADPRLPVFLDSRPRARARPQAVVLAPRPSISLPLSTISPALLAELTSELSTLASVYHKPVQAFIGRGRLTADEVARGGGGSGSGARRNLALDAADDLTNAESATATRAIAVVAQGQRSENLLDFDDDVPAAMSTGTAGSVAPAFGGLGGLDFSGGGGGASGAAPLPAVGARSGALGGKAAQNPLDDLMGLFDSAGLGAGSTSSGMAAGGGGGLNGLGGFGQAQPQSQPQHSQSQKKSDLDLMGDLF